MEKENVLGSVIPNRIEALWTESSCSLSLSLSLIEMLALEDIAIGTVERFHLVQAMDVVVLDGRRDRCR